MSEWISKHSIPWCDDTVNPFSGCYNISAGCANCYAVDVGNSVASKCYQDRGITLAPKPGQRHGAWSGKTAIDYSRLMAFYGVHNPQRVFIDSMTDIFLESNPEKGIVGYTDLEIVRLYKIISKLSWHQIQILTKRPERMAKMYADEKLLKPFAGLRHIHIVTSVEDRNALHRIDTIRKINAPVKGISVEPLLEDISGLNLHGIDWAIVGGESGPNARPFDPDWSFPILKECRKWKTRFFMKQLGEKLNPKDFTSLDTFPIKLRIREFPQLRMLKPDAANIIGNPLQNKWRQCLEKLIPQWQAEADARRPYLTPQLIQIA